MNQLLSFIADFLNGKSIFTPLKRFLNILFSVCIASWIFRKMYFRYVLLDASDLKGIYHFLVSGEFIIPLMIFMVVHFSAGFLSRSVFELGTLYFSDRWRNRILRLQISVEPAKPFWIRYYELIRKSAASRRRDHAKKMLQSIKRTTSINFNLAFKSVIVISIYFPSINYFGWILYSLSIIILLMILVSLFLVYILMELLPAVIHKIGIESEKYSNLPSSD